MLEDACYCKKLFVFVHKKYDLVQFPKWGKKLAILKKKKKDKNKKTPYILYGLYLSADWTTSLQSRLPFKAYSWSTRLHNNFSHNRYLIDVCACQQNRDYSSLLALLI